MASKRKTIFTVGEHGSTVNGFAQRLRSGHDKVTIEWRENGRLRTQSWEYSAPNKKIAKATALGIHERLATTDESAAPDLSLREIFDRYVLAKAPKWRPATKVTTINRWRVFETRLGAGTRARLITPDVLDELRAKLTKEGHAPNQVAHVLSLAKAVWSLGHSRGWLERNPLLKYDVSLGKDESVANVPEFTPAEYGKMWAQSKQERRMARRWRVRVAIAVAGNQGPRQRALLAMKWIDVDLVARTVHWPKDTDKRGYDRVQPLTAESVAMLRVARIWRARIGYEGPFVFPAANARRTGKTWTYQAAVEQLHALCRRAGVVVIWGRGFHAFRRLAAGNILALTGDIKMAGDWIGDKDVRTLAKSYLKERPDALRSVARRYRTAPEIEPTSSTEHQSANEAITPTGGKSL
jgi:integrase